MCLFVRSFYDLIREMISLARENVIHLSDCMSVLSFVCRIDTIGQPVGRLQCWLLKGYELKCVLEN